MVATGCLVVDSLFGLFGEFAKSLPRNDRIEFLRDREINVTLSDVCKQLSGLELVTTKYPEFGRMFTYHVVLDKPMGYIKSAIDKDGKPIKRAYIAEMAYPPRPVFGEDTVTELQLSNWIYNINGDRN